MAVNRYKFKFNLTHGMNASEVNNVEILSDTLFNAIKKIGTLYWRCRFTRVVKVMPDHSENEYPNLIGVSPYSYHGDNFEMIKKLIENSTVAKFKKGSYKYKPVKKKR